MIWSYLLGTSMQMAPLIFLDKKVTKRAYKEGYEEFLYLISNSLILTSIWTSWTMSITH